MLKRVFGSTKARIDLNELILYNWLWIKLS